MASDRNYTPRLLQLRSPPIPGKNTSGGMGWNALCTPASVSCAATGFKPSSRGIFIRSTGSDYASVSFTRPRDLTTTSLLGSPQLLNARTRVSSEPSQSSRPAASPFCARTSPPSRCSPPLPAFLPPASRSRRALLCGAQPSPTPRGRRGSGGTWRRSSRPRPPRGARWCPSPLTPARWCPGWMA